MVFSSRLYTLVLVNGFYCLEFLLRSLNLYVHALATILYMCRVYVCAGCACVEGGSAHASESVQVHKQGYVYNCILAARRTERWIWEMELQWLTPCPIPCQVLSRWPCPNRKVLSRCKWARCCAAATTPCYAPIKPKFQMNDCLHIRYRL